MCVYMCVCVYMKVSVGRIGSSCKEREWRKERRVEVLQTWGCAQRALCAGLWVVRICLLRPAAMNPPPVRGTFHSEAAQRDQGELT